MSFLKDITQTEIFISAHTCATFACMLRVLYKQKNIGSTFARLVILLLLPVFGTIVYILIGESRFDTARAKRTGEMNRFYRNFAVAHPTGIYLNIANQVKSRYHDINKVAERGMGLSATRGSTMSLFSTTDTIIGNMLADIRVAVHSCLLTFHTIEPKSRIEEVLNEILTVKAKDVDCAILTNAVGSRSFLENDWVGKLRRVGAEVHTSLPVGIWRTLFTHTDLHNHRKLLVIDNKIGYTGSSNLVDPHYFKQNSDADEWIGVMMRYVGPMVLELLAVFFIDLVVETNKNLQNVRTYFSQAKNPLPKILLGEMQQGSITAQIIPSTPRQNSLAIYEIIISTIYATTKQIMITILYFAPDEPLLIILTVAAKRGVKVILILPVKVGSLMIRYTSRAYYPMLLGAGVKIAMFEGGLLRAKTMTIDEGYFLFGTVNMGVRSFFLDLGISLAIYDRDTVRQICNLQHDYFENSSCIATESWQQRSKFHDLVENAARLMGPLP